MAIGKGKKFKEQDDIPKNDIELAREQKRLKTRSDRRKKWFILLAIVIVLFLTRDFMNIENLPHWFRVGYNSIVNRQKYPLSTNKGNNLHMEKVGNKPIVVTDSSFFVVGDSGYIQNQGNHTISNPTIHTEDKYFVIYSRSGKSVIVGDTYTSKTHHFDKAILYATVAKNGNFALVTESDRYFNEVVVYNRKGVEIYRWFAAKEYVSNVRFQAGSNGLIVNSLRSDKGKLNTVIYTLRFNKTEEVSRTELEEFLSVSMFEKGGDFTIIGDNKTVVLNPKGEVKSTYDYNGLTLAACDTEDNQVTLALSAGTNSYFHTIVVLDTSLGERAKFNYENSLEYLKRKGNSIFVLNNKIVTHLDMKGAKISETVLQNVGRDMVATVSGATVMSQTMLEKVK